MHRAPPDILLSVFIAWLIFKQVPGNLIGQKIIKDRVEILSLVGGKVYAAADLRRDAAGLFLHIASLLREPDAHGSFVIPAPFAGNIAGRFHLLEQGRERAVIQVQAGSQLAY